MSQHGNIISADDSGTTRAKWGSRKLNLAQPPGGYALISYPPPQAQTLGGGRSFDLRLYEVSVHFVISSSCSSRMLKHVG